MTRWMAQPPEEADVRWHSFVLGLAVAILSAGLAAADDSEVTIPVNVLVTHLSDEEGGVDAGAEGLDRRLRKQFRYNSLRVIHKQRMNLKVDEVGTIQLPNGRAARIRPIHMGEAGVLMAVDVDEAVKTDVRVRNRHMVVIGAGDYGDGTLAISLEPDYEE